MSSEAAKKAGGAVSARDETVSDYKTLAPYDAIKQMKEIIDMLSAALEAATADRAEVEAQALEAAADDWGGEIRSGGAGSWLRARASEIRDGQA